MNPRRLANLAALVLMCLATAGPVLAAQQVWRCGPDGRAFSDRPCSDGSAYSVDDRRDDDEVQAARVLAQREQKLAQALAAERVERSKVPPGGGLSSIGPLQAELDASRRERELSRMKGQRPVQKKLPRRSQSAAGT